MGKTGTIELPCHTDEEAEAEIGAMGLCQGLSQDKDPHGLPPGQGLPLQRAHALSSCFLGGSGRSVRAPAVLGRPFPADPLDSHLGFVGK